MRAMVALGVCAGLVVGGCASTPRAFTPRLASGAADAGFEAAFRACGEAVAAGDPAAFASGKAGNTAQGAAIGGAAAFAAGSSAAQGAGMLAGVAGGIGLGMGLVVFAPAAVWGVSRARRAAKEKRIKEAMDACLAGKGYAVAGWLRAAKGGEGLASPTAAK